MKTVLQYVKPYRGKIALGLVIKFTGTIMDLFLPWILAYIIDSVVPLRDLRLIILWGCVMVVCSVLAITTNICANRMAARVARDTTRRLRHDLFVKAFTLSCRQIDDVGAASLVARLSTDTYNLHHFIGMIQRLGVRAPILLLGGIIVTLTMEPLLALIMVGVMPLIFAIIFTISRRGIPLYMAQQRSTDQLVRSVRENFQGIRIIKALSKTDYEKARFDDVNKNLVGAETKAGLTMAATNPSVSLLLNLGMTLVILAGAFMVNRGTAQPGTILAFTTYFTIILNSMLAINRMFTAFSKGVASASRVEEILLLGEDLKLGSRDHIDGRGFISFENVSFAYGDGRDCLHSVSFTLKKGQTLGVIGRTGSGKSTLIQLLLRFYDPSSGVVRVEGDDVRGIPAGELRARFGVVFQNDFLQAASLRDNIDFGRGLDDESITAAAEDAQAAEFVSALEQGLDAQLDTRGANFSGGQKQRLLIARALAANPEILILDDSSSALDYKTDAALRRAIARRRAGVTSVIVAQRISSIISADLILVMEEGRVIGSGTHLELLESCPAYAEIYAAQMGEMGGEAV